MAYESAKTFDINLKITTCMCIPIHTARVLHVYSHHVSCPSQPLVAVISPSLPV